ncbi:MAG TPA: cytochrome c [Rubricoccaceae bacterium]|nr:cytochrome c [Rubricoccaceae bacterium]
MLRPSRLVLAGLAAVALAGCRGMRSEEPPVHVNLNMDYQERFEEQEANRLFDQAASMRGASNRPLVPGTVARGALRTTASAPFDQGRTAGGAFVPTIPVAVTPEVLERGRGRFNIYCTPCHGYAGDGRGIIMVGNGGQGYGYTPAPTFHSDYLRGVPDGYLFHVISNGVRTMPSYGQQIPVADRWAIVAYLRALQRSQAATPADVPAPERERLATANPNVNVQQ